MEVIFFVRNPGVKNDLQMPGGGLVNEIDPGCGLKIQHLPK